MKGAYSSTGSIPPPTGDLKDILDFLHFHISPERLTTSGEPIYHAFRSIVIGPSAEKRRDLTAYNFDIPLFIDAMIQLLSNRDHIPLQRMSLLILPELDNLLFTSEATFNDPGKFVRAWSTTLDEFMHGATIPQIEVAGVKVLLAIANLSCLRLHIPPALWNLAYKFPTILYTDSPSMQRCIENPDILPSIKGSTGDTDALGWLGMLWMKYHYLSDKVREQLEAETRAIGSSSRHFDLDTYTSLFDFELKRLQAKIEGLKPLDQSVPGLRKELDQMARAKDRLIKIQKEPKEPKQQQNSSQSRGWLRMGIPPKS